MQIGVIGLGRMGGNIVRRLRRDGHECIVYDADPQAVAALADANVHGAPDLANLVTQLDAPRAIWIMLPAGETTDATVSKLGELMRADDIIIDGGNSYFKDDIRRANALSKQGIRYLDVGTSGGVWGLERGYCMMIGGDIQAVVRLDPIFASLAPGTGEIAATPGRAAGDEHAERGYLHCGPSGAGHFVKMIHNGIEYGLMQAYAEGFNILLHAGDNDRPADQRYDLNLPDIAEVWRRGSVIGSWLLDLTAAALAQDEQLDGYSGHVSDSGEGRWTINAAIEEAVPAHVLSAALYARFNSRDRDQFADKLLSAMRHGFGGHVEPEHE